MLSFKKRNTYYVNSRIDYSFEKKICAWFAAVLSQCIWHLHKFLRNLDYLPFNNRLTFVI